MINRIRILARTVVPFSLRRWIAHLRTIRGPADLFGRWVVGGWHASLAHSVTARLWRHVQVGRESIIDPGTHFHSNDDGGGVRIRIGDRCFIGRHCFFSAGERIEIADHCNVGASCNLLAAGHVYDKPTTAYSDAPVVSYGTMRLGPNCWIGVGSTIVGDVSIGFGTVVAAGSLVRGSLPPLSLAAGQPAIVIKVFDWQTQRWKRLPGEEPARSEALRRHLETLPFESDFVSRLRTRCLDRETYE